MRFPTIWYVWPAKPQISLRICAVWSEPLLVARISYECSATDWTPFEISKPKRMLHRLVWVCTCQNATLLGITCHGSNQSIGLAVNLNLGRFVSEFENVSVRSFFLNIYQKINILWIYFMGTKHNPLSETVLLYTCSTYGENVTNT